MGVYGGLNPRGSTSDTPTAARARPGFGPAAAAGFEYGVLTRDCRGFAGLVGLWAFLWEGFRPGVERSQKALDDVRTGPGDSASASNRRARLGSAPRGTGPDIIP